ncbi:polyhydroxyalkanoate depolymerase [Kiloniella laminariae]|uniref:Polyhydroxyalkanoate depolymerase n=1 Tax=Kiloniella laminariae TaxID=454162 RepID=A0ABT4LG77_9PROT|nr:polyhydroxyalkanoate depolymerase [Kiloniella laminariae]MCZ4280102.1 polyhydroxyalkanoate depolymerase [Kiloniella laminariae]
MLYNYFDMQNAALGPMRAMAQMTKTYFSHPMMPLSRTYLGKIMSAGADVLEGVIRHRGKPEWGFQAITDDKGTHPIDLARIDHKPFADLIRFRCDLAKNPKKVLLVSPMSGHFATLLRGTVLTLVKDHEVYVTDWADASSVPATDGTFGLDDYIQYIVDYIRLLGPDVHVIAVCQPAPLVLAAVAILAGENDPCQPSSMTLMGGPVDPGAAETEVTKLADSQSLSWFKENLTASVPMQYPGSGRRVYPGFMQLAAFISMNSFRHVDAHMQHFNNLIVGDGDSAESHTKFYDEYLSVMDVTAEFYLDTIQHVFQERSLPKGTMVWKDIPVDPSKITKTALLTVEGELDDISAPGQTEAAHGLCSSLAQGKHKNHVEKGVGHYGIFNGRKWRENIYPVINEFIEKNHNKS